MVDRATGGVTELPLEARSVTASLHAVGGRVLFAADTSSFSGNELWVTDGTPEGTGVLRDIEPGPDTSNPSDFIVMNGRLLFTAETRALGRELWVSDGTPEGTQPLIDLAPGLESGLLPWAGLDGRIADIGNGWVAFSGNDGVSGAEPWITDGTVEGTRRLADVAIGPKGSSPRNFVQIGDRLFFIADGSAPDAIGNGAIWSVELPPVGSGAR